MTPRTLISKDILTTDLVIPERPIGDPDEFPDSVVAQELTKCSEDLLYFIHNYIWIRDEKKKKWSQFKLYPAQINAAEILLREKYIIWLKARQIGASTLCGGAYFLWLILFEENAFTLVLSKTEREAQALLTQRFKPMFNKLPFWMKPSDLSADSKSELALSTGGVLQCLPTSGGDSYTARAVLVDEAALVHRSRTALSQVLLNVEPTTDAGGQLIFVSKADKERPESTFNSIFTNAIEGKNDFFPIFAPWQAVPWRSKTWYDSKVRLSLSINKTMDYVFENYPETVDQALSPKSSDKRLTAAHIEQCYVEMDGLSEEEMDSNYPPLLPSLVVYGLPDIATRYILCIDPAEGNPNSDDTVIDVFDWSTGEQVAHMSGKFEPAVAAEYAGSLSEYYHHAPAWVERNNHGHAVSLALLELTDVRVLKGPDSPAYGKAKYGYHASIRSKAIAYSELAERLRKKEIIIHNRESKRQLQSIVGSTLSAPSNDHDDHATVIMLYAAAKKYVHLTLLLDFV